MRIKELVYTLLLLVLPLKTSGIVKCQRCHSEVWRDWRGSLHMQAFEDPVFQGSLREIPVKERDFCLKCHDPLDNKSGITCQYCHRISGISEGEVPPLYLSLSDTIYGPYTPSRFSPHPVKVSKLLRKSRFCGACHDVKNKRGFLLFSTYSEWKDSPYAIEGVSCQKCHMPEDLLRSPVNPPHKTKMVLTAHGFQGGHRVEQIQKAVELVLFPVKKWNPLKIRIDITNREAGHFFPTGIPTRWVRLQVNIFDTKDKLLGRAEKIYERVIADSLGSRLTSFKEMFFQASQVLSDNRIPPRETIHEELTFPTVEKKGVSRIQASLYYEMGDLPVPEGAEARVLLASEELSIVTGGASRYLYWFIVLSVIFLIAMAIGFLIGRKRLL